METIKPERSNSNSVSSADSAVTTPVFHLGETVYSTIAADERGMITAIVQRPGYVTYFVAWASNHIGQEQEFNEIELSREPLYHTPTR